VAAGAPFFAAPCLSIGRSDDLFSKFLHDEIEVDEGKKQTLDGPADKAWNVATGDFGFRWLFTRCCTINQLN